MAWGLTLTAALLLAEIPQVSPAPALQLCYRRQLVLGEVAKFEVSPAGGEVLTDGCEVELQLRDQTGRLIGEFPLQTIFAGSTNSLAFHYATETSPDALTLCPELAVRWREREFRYSAALPAAGLQATGNSDCEWHQLPLRALSADAAGACRPSASAVTSGYRTRLKIFSETCGRPIEVEVDADRVPLLEYDLSPWIHQQVGWSGGGRDYDGELGCIRSGRGSPQFVDQGFAVSALRFDGEGAIFRLPAAALPARAAWRFAFDFKPEGDGVGMEVFSSGTEEVRERLSEIKVLESGALAARLRLEDGRTVTLTSMYKVRPNVWNHVELDCDLDKVTLTLNRREPAVATIAAPIGNSEKDSWFGGRPGAYFKGMLKNVRIVHDPAAADRTTDVMFFFDTDFSEMPALKDFRIAGGWGINNDEFQDRFLSNRLRWQLWTLRIE